MPAKNQTSSHRDKSFCNEENLRIYLKNKAHFTLEERALLKYYIDNYSDCWRMWNKVRWDAAMNSVGVQELKEYLGKKFIPYYDSSWGLAKEWHLKKRNTKKAIEEFYKNTKNYIYNSIIFFYSKDRMDLHDFWLNLKERHSIQKVVDYGSGVGNDGLEMLKMGVEVVFCDFDSPTQDFLKWRLQKRRIPTSKYKVINVKQLKERNESADMFWAIDVIEHMVNPLEIFESIHINTKLIVFFTDCDDKAGGRHPFHFNVNMSQLEKELKSRNYRKQAHPILEVWQKIDS